MDASLVTGGPSHLRRMNQEAILRLVQRAGPISRMEIAKTLGLNPSTVNRLVEQLVQAGLLLVVGERSTSRRGGRPARLVHFNANAAHVAALDLSNVPWRAALTNLAGEIVQTFEAVPAPGDAEANLDVLETLVETLLAHNGHINGPPLRGIGVGAPSITLWESGTVVWAASLGWRDLPLKAWMENRWPIPAFVENDVNLLALGENWLGAGQQAAHLAVVSVGTGIGAGLILNGRLYRGANEAAGEVGYLPPDVAALGQVYTGFGPLEALAAAPGLVERALQAIRHGETGLLAQALDGVAANGRPHLTAEHVYRAARQGDHLARQLLAETADYLSLAVAGLAVVLNPEMILLGGEMARAADLLLAPIRQRLQGLLPVMPRLDPVQLGDDGVMLGAVALVLRNTSPEVAGMKAGVPHLAQQE